MSPLDVNTMRSSTKMVSCSCGLWWGLRRFPSCRRSCWLHLSSIQTVERQHHRIMGELSVDKAGVGRGSEALKNLLSFKATGWTQILEVVSVKWVVGFFYMESLSCSIGSSERLRRKWKRFSVWRIQLQHCCLCNTESWSMFRDIDWLIYWWGDL